MDTKKYFGVKMIEPKEDDFAYFEPHFMAQNCSFPGKIMSWNSVNFAFKCRCVYPNLLSPAASAKGG